MKILEHKDVGPNPVNYLEHYPFELEVKRKRNGTLYVELRRHEDYCNIISKIFDPECVPSFDQINKEIDSALRGRKAFVVFNNYPNGKGSNYINKRAVIFLNYKKVMGEK